MTEPAQNDYVRVSSVYLWQVECALMTARDKGMPELSTLIEETHELRFADYGAPEFRPTVLSAAAFDALLAWLEGPPEPIPGLVERFKKLREARAYRTQNDGSGAREVEG